MKLFISDPSVWTADLSSLSPVLAFHWEGVTPSERRTGRPNPASPFVLVDAPDRADMHVLPYEWNHYIWTKRIPDAQALGAAAAQHGKQILIWHSGDLPPVVPIPNAVAFQSALYRSRLRPHQHAAPSFVRDPLAVRGGVVAPRRKQPTPVIGFCGYAGVVPLKIAYGVYSALKHNVLFHAGRTPYEAMPLLPATLLRARALRALSSDTRVTANFLINTRAFKRHDRKTPAETRAQQIAAFDHNVHESDYTLCIRGYGNWSRRFYETLASGRIPVFIDTDCVLPGWGKIDWKQYCVWVDQDDLSSLTERILEFHARLGPDEFIDRQRACRRLWDEWLSPAGFMARLSEQLGPAGRSASLSSARPRAALKLVATSPRHSAALEEYGFNRR